MQQPDFEQWYKAAERGFMYNEDGNGVGIYTVPSFTDSGLVKHGFTSRKGGVSEGGYASLNMSWERTNSIHETRENYRIAATAMGIDPDDLVIVHGNHGTNILQVDASYKGKGYSDLWNDDDIFFDGMATDGQKVAISTIHGDCTPLFLLDPVKKAICLCHSGWRGTVAGMAERAVECMEAAYRSNPEDLLVAIGPCIGKCCFEVGEDVAEAFKQAYPACDCVEKAEAEGKYFVDIPKVTAWQFYSKKILAENLTIAGLCTCCDNEMFHSFRRDGKAGGSMASMLELK